MLCLGIVTLILIHRADARMAVSGGLDNGFRMACWSPSGLSDLGGWADAISVLCTSSEILYNSCILAVLNLNREVSIWLPGSNSIKSSWSKVGSDPVTYRRYSLTAMTGVRHYRAYPRKHRGE